KEAEAGIDTEINKLKTILVSEEELSKVKNKVISAHMFSELNILNKAMNLATSELLGDPNLVNLEVDLYNAVSSSKIKKVANAIFRNENSNTLYYHAK
ncbi:MAG: insulinase family protein, partial [Flavobacteriales bacterium]|nr:insulinase family protein [Flavobacteriales bacterium]